MSKYPTCPFCSMPMDPKKSVVIDQNSQSLCVECPSCFACGPRETEEAEAIRSWNLREHDVEWRYKKGLKIAQRICAAVGQTNGEKIYALAVEIGETLAD